MRGEYLASLAPEPTFLGSPPHAWGIPRLTSGAASRSGITPTCVGNTSFGTRSSPSGKDHPHMRGEYQKNTLCNIGRL